MLNDWSPLKNRIQSILERFKRKGGYHAELAMDTEQVLREVVGQINDTSRNLISPSPEYVEQVEPRWLADIVSELKRITLADEPINVCLVVTEERLVFRHRRTINPKAKTVILDAYGRPELYQQVCKVLGRRVTRRLLRSSHLGRVDPEQSQPLPGRYCHAKVDVHINGIAIYEPDNLRSPYIKVSRHDDLPYAGASR